MTTFDGEQIRYAIQAKYGKAFAACKRILEIAAAVETKNKDKVQVATARPSTGAVAFFYAKATKSFKAILCLAGAGYGEDALILARSLTNLCLDLSFICQENSEERARDWIAAGENARRTMANRFGTKLPEDSKTNWEDIKTRAKRWKDLGIEGRARSTKRTDIYDLAYRHGSSFEHSDSWSSISYLAWGEATVELQVAPSEAFVWHALIVGAHAFGSVIIDWGTFFGMDHGNAEKDIAGLAETHFRVKGDPAAVAAPELA